MSFRRPDAIVFFFPHLRIIHPALSGHLFFHGYGERYNKCLDGKNYDRGSDYGGDNIANFVATHDVVIVKWDGYNPRTPDEDYPRPYNVGPVETNRQFPLYFPNWSPIRRPLPHSR